MVDLETLGHTTTAAIASIGAVYFNPDGDLPALADLPSSDRFYAVINLDSCLSYGLTVDGSTVAWWLRQQDAQRHEIAGAVETGQDLRGAMRWLTVWCRALSLNRVWSHGASFDIPILEYAAKRVGYSLPWHFKDVRDTRTLFDLSGVRYSSGSGDKAHNALDDAYRQAVVVQKAWKVLRDR
jgi:hypothetical protein